MYLCLQKQSDMKRDYRRQGAVLFIHGIVGNSRFFDFLLPSVPQGYECHALTLAGHGGDALSFSRASMAQWHRQVDEVVEELRHRCERVVIVAHSMGTLFAIRQAATKRADAILLLNPPLRIRLTYRLFVTPVKVILGLTSNPVTVAAKAAYGVSLDYNPLHYYGWPCRYLELFAEIRETRGMVSQLSCRTVVFVAEHDEMVSPKSAAYFANLDNCQVALLPTSGHYYYSPADRECISRSLSELLSEKY